MSANKKITVLATAYAVNPFKGSEDGMGWNILNAIAKENNVIAVTRVNNQAEIDRYIKENPSVANENLSFVYFDLPYWMRFWKNGSRGALLYYFLWQIGCALMVIKRKYEFDIAHGLNFHNDWIPTMLWLTGKPTVWGPVGHHPKIPKNFLLEAGGYAAYFRDRIKHYGKVMVRNCNPLMWICKAKTQKVIVMNSAVPKALGLSNDQYITLPSTATKSVQGNPNRDGNKFSILSVGRFVPLKGFDVTLKAFSKFYNNQSTVTQQQLELTLIGKGPMKNQLQNFADQSNAKDAINIVEWMPHDEVLQQFKSASVFCFPSHEGAGMVVPEAMAAGNPVLCFDNVGPGEFITEDCGFKIPYGNYDEAIDAFAKKMEIICNDPKLRYQMAKKGIEHYEKYFTWERKGEVITLLYKEILVIKEEQFDPVKEVVAV